MAFSISDFRSNALGAGGARANLFDVTISGVGATGNLSSGALKEFVFACKAAQIPPSTIGVVEVPYFGRVVKVPGNKTFENWNVTIINDENFDIRSGMEEWMASMSSHLGNLNTATNENLYGTGVVKQYPKTGATAGTIAEYKFEKIFPVNISEIALDWSSNDAIEEFTVEFAYDYWTHAGVALG
jgi:hypothetical protein